MTTFKESKSNTIEPVLIIKCKNVRINYSDDFVDCCIRCLKFSIAQSPDGCTEDFTDYLCNFEPGTKQADSEVFNEKVYKCIKCRRSALNPIISLCSANISSKCLKIDCKCKKNENKFIRSSSDDKEILLSEDEEEDEEKCGSSPLMSYLSSGSSSGELRKSLENLEQDFVSGLDQPCILRKTSKGLYRCKYCHLSIPSDMYNRAALNKVAFVCMARSRIITSVLDCIHSDHYLHRFPFQRYQV